MKKNREAILSEYEKIGLENIADREKNLKELKLIKLNM